MQTNSPVDVIYLPSDPTISLIVWDETHFTHPMTIGLSVGILCAIATLLFVLFTVYNQLLYVRGKHPSQIRKRLEMVGQLLKGEVLCWRADYTPDEDGYVWQVEIQYHFQTPAMRVIQAEKKFNETKPPLRLRRTGDLQTSRHSLRDDMHRPAVILYLNDGLYDLL